MWISEEKKWMEEPELAAYIKNLKKERDEYKQKVADLLAEIRQLQLEEEIEQMGG